MLMLFGLSPAHHETSAVIPLRINVHVGKCLLQKEVHVITFSCLVFPEKQEHIRTQMSVVRSSANIEHPIEACMQIRHEPDIL